MFNFTAAEEKCLSERAHVSSILSSEEQAFLWNDHRLSKHWLGAKYINGAWTWLDRSPWDFTSWGETEPSNPEVENCLERLSSIWNDVQCDKIYHARGLPFACKKGKLYNYLPKNSIKIKSQN